MKEIDYILATDLGKTLSLQRVLEELRPIENNPIIYEEEYAQVRKILSHWTNRTFKVINKDDSEPSFFDNVITGEKNNKPKI